MELELKIANLKEIIEKCDYEIKIHPNNNLWVESKAHSIENYNNGGTITFIGKLNGEIIVEASAAINKIGLKYEAQNTDGLCGDGTAYLFAFRTNKPYRGQGYFSKLYKFMEDTLKQMGFTTLVLGVEPNEIENMQIYFHYGFTNFLRLETFPPTAPKTEPELVLFYAKNL